MFETGVFQEIKKKSRRVTGTHATGLQESITESHTRKLVPVITAVLKTEQKLFSCI